jgi:hypothetical protein
LLQGNAVDFCVASVVIGWLVRRCRQASCGDWATKKQLHCFRISRNEICGPKRNPYFYGELARRFWLCVSEAGREGSFHLDALG